MTEHEKNITIKFVDNQKHGYVQISKYDLEGMRKFINASSLEFLSIEGLYKSMGFSKRNDVYPQFTDHCFTGDYPVNPIDANSKLNRDIDQAIANSRSIDTLRTLNNQKVSYEGRVIRGEKINKRGTRKGRKRKRKEAKQCRKKKRKNCVFLLKNYTTAAHCTSILSTIWC